jgi:hypothetical protein
MATREDVEAYLMRLELEYEELETGMWRVEGNGLGAGLVLHVAPPVLVFRLKVMDLPEDERRCSNLYRQLLEYNATDLMHAAYGLEEGDVILTEALPLENLDFNEFQAAVDSFQVALATHMETLAPFQNC